MRSGLRYALSRAEALFLRMQELHESRYPNMNPNNISFCPQCLEEKQQSQCCPKSRNNTGQNVKSCTSLGKKAQSPRRIAATKLSMPGLRFMFWWLHRKLKHYISGNRMMHAGGDHDVVKSPSPQLSLPWLKVEIGMQGVVRCSILHI